MAGHLLDDAGDEHHRLARPHHLVVVISYLSTDMNSYALIALASTSRPVLSDSYRQILLGFSRAGCTHDPYLQASAQIGTNERPYLIAQIRCLASLLRTYTKHSPPRLSVACSHAIVRPRSGPQSRLPSVQRRHAGQATMTPVEPLTSSSGHHTPSGSSSTPSLVVPMCVMRHPDCRPWCCEDRLSLISRASNNIQLSPFHMSLVARNPLRPEQNVIPLTARHDYHSRRSFTRSTMRCRRYSTWPSKRERRPSRKSRDPTYVLVDVYVTHPTPVLMRRREFLRRPPR
ncbi:hypothetical protein LshimejAT787_1105630 [Lyophyllum shimeji]|uniref:Uncharacterized protein n=1 Tax=Lyophyllum shimeji TaxID=47721 RepID=A0A9P3URD2_LYOSH|nr:hypothetical protein LshimejAT787_1105630 [Lyophyllum shimeji]